MGYSGPSALKVSGRKTTGNAKNNVVIFEGLNLQIFKNMQLSYMIFPDYTGENDDSRTGQYISIDLAFTDGTYLSDLGAEDINGHLMNPLSQGKARSMYRRQWNYVCCKVSEKARSKTVDKIIVRYERDEDGDDILTYIDDIAIQTVEPEQKDSPADYVLTTRGTDNTGSYSHGQTYPAVSVPNGFNALTPFTGTDKYLYTYGSDSIQPSAQAIRPTSPLSTTAYFSLCLTSGRKIPTKNRSMPKTVPHSSVTKTRLQRPITTLSPLTRTLLHRR